MLGYLEVCRKFVESPEEVLVPCISLCSEFISLFVEESVAGITGDALRDIEMNIGKSVCTQRVFEADLRE